MFEFLFYFKEHIYIFFFAVFVVSYVVRGCVVLLGECSQSTEERCNKRKTNVADPPYPPLNDQIYFCVFSISKASQLTRL